MRGRRVIPLLAACHAAAPAPAPSPPHAKPFVAVVGLDAPDDARPLAHAITDELRAAAAARYQLSSNRDDLRDLQDLASCPDRAAASCIADIGAFLDADFVIYGRLERRGAKYALALDLLDVAQRFTRRAVAVEVENPQAAARDAFAKLAGPW